MKHRDRLVSEQAVVLEEPCFRKLVESSRDAVVLADHTGTIHFATESVFQTLGYTAAECLQRNISDFVQPDEGARFACALDEINAFSGHSLKVECQTRHSTGESRWAELLGTNLLEDPDVRAVMWQLRDITERRKAEQALRESKARNRALLEATPDFLFRIRGDGTFLEYHANEKDKLAVSPEHFLNRSIYECMPQSFAETMMSHVRAVLDSGEPRSVEYELPVAMSPDDRGCYEARIVAAGGDEVVSIVRDFSDRKRAERALVQSQRFIERITSASPHIIHVFDVRQLKTVYANRHIAAELGYSDEQQEHLGESILELLHPEDRARFHDWLGRLGHMDDDQIVEGEIRLRHADGSWRWFLTRNSVFSRTAEGQVEQIVGGMQDITRRKQAEEELQQREAELAHVARLSIMGELVAGITHEICQPLYAITNFASAIANTVQNEQPLPHERLLAWSQDIVRGATRAGEIIGRWREFICNQRCQPQEVALDVLLEESLQLVAFQARNSHVMVSIETAPPSPIVYVDRIQLQQVLVNLIQNALEAMDEKPEAQRRVTVRSELVEQEARVSVIDSGTGINASVADRLFDAFVTTKRNGMGMGLPISRTIIENHGGRLWTTSNPAGGSCFQFTLPARMEAFKDGG